MRLHIRLLSQSLSGLLLYHRVWGSVIGTILVPFSLVYLTSYNSICVVFSVPFWGICSGIYLVLNSYTLVWRGRPFFSCIPIPILCCNRVIPPSPLQIHNSFQLYHIGAWHVVFPHIAFQNNPPIMIKLWSSTYASKNLVCVVSDIKHVVLGIVWVSCWQLYLPVGGHTPTVVFHLIHIYCVQLHLDYTVNSFIWNKAYVYSDV